MGKLVEFHDISWGRFLKLIYYCICTVFVWSKGSILPNNIQYQILKCVVAGSLGEAESNQADLLLEGSSRMKRHIPPSLLLLLLLLLLVTMGVNLGPDPSYHPIITRSLKPCQQCHPRPGPDLNLVSTKSWIDSFWTFGDLTGQLDLNWAQSVVRPWKHQETDGTQNTFGSFSFRFAFQFFPLY